MKKEEIKEMKNKGMAYHDNEKKEEMKAMKSKMKALKNCVK